MAQLRKLAHPRVVFLILPALILAVSLTSCRRASISSEWPVISHSPVIALVNGTLIDGSGADPVSDAVILIQDGRILAAGPGEQVRVPAEARVLDVRGGTVLPGFINAHVHDGFNPTNLRTWLDGGVTTVRDEGCRSPSRLAELLEQRKTTLNQPVYARVVSAGCMITRPGGYGALHVSSAAEARLAVQGELAQGADLIKVSEEDGYAGTSGLPKLSAEELAAVITAAHERAVKVSAHITQAIYMEMVAEAGVDDVAHMAYEQISDKTITRMVEKGIYVTPTFSVLRSYGAIGSSVDNLRRLVAAGGKVALGNDYGGGRTLDGFELGIPMYEIEMMQSAGMTPMQILVASTRNAAAVCGRESDLGTLQPGKIADVLVVRGDPLADLQALKQVWWVIKDGVVRE